MNIIELFDVAEMGIGSADYIHTFVEAKKLAFEDRAKYYSDPDFNDLSIEMLISKDYLFSNLKFTCYTKKIA